MNNGLTSIDQQLKDICHKMFPPDRTTCLSEIIKKSLEIRRQIEVSLPTIPIDMNVLCACIVLSCEFGFDGQAHSLDIKRLRKLGNVREEPLLKMVDKLRKLLQLSQTHAETQQNGSSSGGKSLLVRRLAKWLDDFIVKYSLFQFKPHLVKLGENLLSHASLPPLNALIESGKEKEFLMTAVYLFLEETKAISNLNQIWKEEFSVGKSRSQKKEFAFMKQKFSELEWFKEQVSHASKLTVSADMDMEAGLGNSAHGQNIKPAAVVTSMIQDGRNWQQSANYKKWLIFKQLLLQQNKDVDTKVSLFSRRPYTPIEQQL
jgi:hypothetical protein